MRALSTLLPCMGFLLLWLAGPAPALAAEAGNGFGEGRKVALVVGNRRYQHTTQLPQAPGDARAVADSLRSLGFTVVLLQDATRSKLLRGLVDFGEQLAGAQVGFFYYAGHAVQVEGANYIVPVDADLERPGYATSDAVDATKVLHEMARAGSQLNVVVLDACRNNPFVGQWEGTSRAFGERGLVAMPTPGTGGFLVAFATAPGAVAEDSGVYARALVQGLQEPCVALPQVFGRVHDQVRQATADAQRPWLNVGAGDVAYSYFPAGCAAPASPEPPRVAESSVEPAPPPPPARPAAAGSPDLRLGVELGTHLGGRVGVPFGGSAVHAVDVTASFVPLNPTEHHFLGVPPGQTECCTRITELYAAYTQLQLGLSVAFLGAGRWHPEATAVFGYHVWGSAMVGGELGVVYDSPSRFELRVGGGAGLPTNDQLHWTVWPKLAGAWVW